MNALGTENTKINKTWILHEKAAHTSQGGRQVARQLHPQGSSICE